MLPRDGPDLSQILTDLKISYSYLSFPVSELPALVTALQRLLAAYGPSIPSSPETNIVQVCGDKVVEVELQEALIDQDLASFVDFLDSVNEQPDGY